MTTGIRPCRHQLAATPGAPAFDVVHTLDFQAGGAAEALVRCRSCGSPALLALLDWSGPALARRIYRLSGLREADVAVYLRDVERGSCDVGRASRELEALLCCAGETAALLALDLSSNQVLACREVSRDSVVPEGPWREVLPDALDLTWYSWLGVGKA